MSLENPLKTPHTCLIDIYAGFSNQLSDTEHLTILVAGLKELEKLGAQTLLKKLFKDLFSQYGDAYIQAFMGNNDPTLKLPSGLNSMMVAAAFGHRSDLERLHALGYGLDEQHATGGPALFFALAHGRFDQAHCLIELGASPHQTNLAGCYPFNECYGSLGDPLLRTDIPAPLNHTDLQDVFYFLKTHGWSSQSFSAAACLHLSFQAARMGLPALIDELHHTRPLPLAPAFARASEYLGSALVEVICRDGIQSQRHLELLHFLFDQGVPPYRLNHADQHNRPASALDWVVQKPHLVLETTELFLRYAPPSNQQIVSVLLSLFTHSHAHSPGVLQDLMDRLCSGLTEKMPQDQARRLLYLMATNGYGMLLPHLLRHGCAEELPYLHPSHLGKGQSLPTLLASSSHFSSSQAALSVLFERGLSPQIKNSNDETLLDIAQQSHGSASDLVFFIQAAMETSILQQSLQPKKKLLARLDDSLGLQQRQRL